MLDQEFSEKDSICFGENHTEQTRPLSLMQLSLFELFFLTTFVATAFAVYLYCSQVLALLGGGCLIVMVVVRVIGPENVVLSGIFTFVVSAAVVVFIALVLQQPSSDSSLLFFLPLAGYFYGFMVAAFRDHSL